MMTKYCTFTAGDESFSHENNLNKTYIYECSGDPMNVLHTIDLSYVSRETKVYSKP